MKKPSSEIVARIAENKLSFRLDKARSSRKYSDAETLEIEKIWQDRVNNTDANIFDGAIFSLEEMKCLDDGLDITCSLTSYKYYVGTRDPNVAISRVDPIGTIIVPITSDGYVPVGMRSGSAEANPGKYFTFGGYFDPTDDTDVNGVPDITKCVQRELHEELGCTITVDDISLLGVIYDNVFCHPEVCALVRLKEKSSDLLKMNWMEELQSLEYLDARDRGIVSHVNEELMAPALGSALVLANEHLASELNNP